MDDNEPAGLSAKTLEGAFYAQICLAFPKASGRCQAQYPGEDSQLGDTLEGGHV